MASITLHFPFSSFRYSSCSYPSQAQLSCSASVLLSHHISRKGFMDFPYISPSQKNLMADLASTLETRRGSILKPCSLPPDVQSYQNETETAHAGLHLKSGIQSSKLPSGGALNITSLAVYLNSLTDSPNILVELIVNSPTSMILILDLPPRKDLILNPDYLKTFYEDTQVNQHRQYFENLKEVIPYVPSSLYIRLFFSPTAVLVCIETEQLDKMINIHVTPIAKEVLKTWLEFCPFGKRVVGESGRENLRMSRSKTIEIELGSSLPPFVVWERNR